MFLVVITWLYLYCVLIELNIESLVKNQVRVHNILIYCFFSGRFHLARVATMTAHARAVDAGRMACRELKSNFGCPGAII